MTARIAADRTQIDDGRPAVAGAHRRGDRVGGGAEALLVESVAEGVVRTLAGEQADRGAQLTAATGLFDAAVLETDPEGLAILHVHFREVAAPGQRRARVACTSPRREAAGPLVARSRKPGADRRPGHKLDGGRVRGVERLIAAVAQAQPHRR